jgi:hypothetical protein
MNERSPQSVCALRGPLVCLGLGVTASRLLKLGKESRLRVNKAGKDVSTLAKVLGVGLASIYRLIETLTTSPG